MFLGNLIARLAAEHHALSAEDRLSDAVCGFQPHYQVDAQAEWIAHRDFTPIKPTSDDALIEYARAHRVAAE
jgi:hypothetical protein